ncbi:hypothetical protein C8Q77DRAFT_1038401, partial [Trametes polyzona]
LTENERDNIRVFRLRFLANISRRAYNEMRRSFAHKIKLNSDWVVLYRVARLSGVRPQWIQCCVNSCLCYLGEFEHAMKCPECSEQRYTDTGHPRRYFCYIPLIPRLQAYFQSIDLIRLLQYRTNFHDDPNKITDVFSSELYRRLLRTNVVVDGQQLPHRHFSDPRDVAFSLCADSYLLF